MSLSPPSPLSYKYFLLSSPSPARCAASSCPGPVPPPVPWRACSVVAPDIFVSWLPATPPQLHQPGLSTSRSLRAPASQETLTRSLTTSCVWPEILTAAGKDLYYQHVNSCKAFRFNKRSIEMIFVKNSLYCIVNMCLCCTVLRNKKYN